MEKSFQRGYASLDSIFEFVTGFLDQAAAGDAVTFSIKLAVEELFTNMVKYNPGSGEITIRMAREDDAVIVELLDDDVDPFDPANAAEASTDEPIEERRIGGLGLRLVRSAVDKISYEYDNRRMTIRLRKTLERH